MAHRDFGESGCKRAPRLRVFDCGSCGLTVHVCRKCDRRRKYCSPACAKEAERARQRRFDRSYRQTARGRVKARERKRRQRERERERRRVTEGQVTEGNATELENSSGNVPGNSADSGTAEPRCHFCGSRADAPIWDPVALTTTLECIVRGSVPAQEVEDIVQEALASLLRAQSQSQEVVGDRFAKAVARNLCANHFRKSGRMPAIQLLTEITALLNATGASYLERAFAGILQVNNMLFLDVQRAGANLSVRAARIDATNPAAGPRAVSGAEVQALHVLNGHEEQSAPATDATGTSLFSVGTLSHVHWNFDSVGSPGYTVNAAVAQVTSAREPLDIHVHDGVAQVQTSFLSAP